MKTKIILIVTCVLLSLPAMGYAKEKIAKLVFPQNKFSINLLEGESDKVDVQALIMCLPAEGLFQSNVNVQIQPYRDTMKQYVYLSFEQLKQLNLTEINRTLNRNVATFEYKGVMNNMNLHFYSKAILTKDHKIILATGTTSASSWDNDKAKIKSCVDSVQVLR